MALRNFIIALLHHPPKSSVPPFCYHNSISFCQPAPTRTSHLISLFQTYGFPPAQIPNFIKINQFLLTPTPEEIGKSFQILASLIPSRDFLVSTVTGCPSVLRLDFLEKWQSGVSQLGISGISALAIRNVLEIATKLGLTPDDISRCLGDLKRLGLSEGTITRVLEMVPLGITSTEDEIKHKIEFLLGIGIQTREIDRIFGLFPEILTVGAGSKLQPLLDEFRDLGFPLNEIKKQVLREPKVLGLENGEISQCIEMLRSLKCRPAIRESIFRDGEFQAGYKTKLRVDCLRKHGMTYRDAFTVLWKDPRVILYDMEDIEKKINFLVDKMKFDAECLVDVPEYLGVNFDKQIVPRFNVIEYLRSIGGLGDEVGLRNLVKLSRLRFYNMYVRPYPECEKIYGRVSGGAVGGSCQPVGMWKLFSPQKYPDSHQDNRNIKAYMESLP